MLHPQRSEDVRRNALWSFETAQFFVAYTAETEDTDPADHFDDPETVADIRAGLIDWFCARVTVYWAPSDDMPWLEIGSDYLGGCAYKSARSFAEGDERSGYFRDMVRQAIAAARANVARLTPSPLRHA